MNTKKELSRSASFWVAAAVVAHTLWTSAAPAMSYRLYALEWHLTPTITTGIFAIYPIVVVAILILFGDISDYIGRRSTIMAGLGASLIGVLIFAIAPSISWIFAGRAFMGIGVGLSASAAAAAIVEYSPPGESQKASAITTVAQAVGLASAMLFGGALIQYAPFPMHLNFWGLSAVILALFVAAYFLPRENASKTSSPWRPKGPSVHRSLRKEFIVSMTSVTAAYALGALILSLGGQIAHDLIGSNNTLINGAVMSVFALAAGVAAIAGQTISSRAAIKVGGAFTVIGVVIVMLAVLFHSLPIFLIAIAASGIGYSLLFLGGLKLINEVALPHHRGGTVSAVYFVAYFGQGAIALTLGVLATHYGLAFAIDIGSVVIAILGALAFYLALVFAAERNACPSDIQLSVCQKN